MTRLTYKLLLLIASFIPVVAAADTAWPQQPIRMIVPFPPGGNTDTVARLIAEKIQQKLGQTVVIENKSGAGGAIATAYVAKANPDGYTILMQSTGPHLIAPQLPTGTPYGLKDFKAISNVSSNAQALLVTNSLPVKNVRELIDLAKKSPGLITFGSAGLGTTTHLAGEQFKMLSGVEILHIPFRGGSPATLAAVAGQVQMTFANLSDALPQIEGGKLRGIAVTSAKRQPFAQNLPTIAESGLPGYENTVWNGLVAPAGTPDAFINKIAGVVQEASKDPKFVAALARIGSIPVGDSPQEFTKYLNTEYARWGEVLKKAKVE